MDEIGRTISNFGQAKVVRTGMRHEREKVGGGRRGVGRRKKEEGRQEGGAQAEGDN
jgi:hypothetical protein